MILYMYFSYIIVGSDYPTSRYWDVVEGEPFPTPNEDEDDPNNPLFYLRRALGWQNNISRAGRELANLCRRVQFGCDRVPEIPQWRIPHLICPSRWKTNLFEIICNNYFCVCMMIYICVEMKSFTRPVNLLARITTATTTAFPTNTSTSSEVTSLHRLMRLSSEIR